MRQLAPPLRDHSRDKADDRLRHDKANAQDRLNQFRFPLARAQQKTDHPWKAMGQHVC